MDVSVPYNESVKSVKKDLIRSNDWGLLWSGNSKQGTSSVGNLAAEIGSALVLLSISSPPLEGHKDCVGGKDQKGEKIFAIKDMGAKLTSKPELKGNKELPNSKSMSTSEEDVNEKKKISEMAMVEKPQFGSSLKLVSAMKGSREKRGIHVEKLSISWAADVYDPPVSSQSHSLTDDNQHGYTASKKSNRNKNKHKSKSRKNNTEKKKNSKTSRNSSKVASY